MRLITVVMTGIMLAGACLGQSSSYPGSVDTDATLFVAKDNVQTKLNVQMLITDNVAIVASTTGWAANMIATVDSEQMFVTGVSNIRDVMIDVRQNVRKSRLDPFARTRVIRAIDKDHGVVRRIVD